nr:ferric/cupric reductase transmembrane component 2 [Quercus suber]
MIMAIHRTFTIATLALLAAALPHAIAEKAETPEELAAEAVVENENWKIVRYIAWTWIAVVGVTFIYRWTIYLFQHIRLLANLTVGSAGDGKQRYFSIPHENWARVKRYLITAPLFNKRHHREFRMSTAINVGTLPGRLQTLFLVGYFVMNIALCAITIEWTQTTFYSDAVKRTGTIAVVNMIPLFLLAGRNNPLIAALGISFDTYNLIHRWIGRIVVFEAVAHGAFWAAGKIASMGARKGWATIGSAMSSQFILTGVIGAFAFIAILLHSPSIIRHAFYETFLHVHILLAATAAAAVWVHTQEMEQHKFVVAAVVFWVLERFLRIASLIYRNTGRSITKADVEALPGDALRVTLHITRPWDFRPGQHIYLYMPSIGLWTSHPFSLAWSSDEPDPASEKILPTSHDDPLALKKTTMSLIIRRRTGFTDTLFRKAERAPGGTFRTTALVEGPYGHQSFRSYGTVMLFAAGVGITHQVPHVRDLVAAHAAGLAATRRVVLVWVIQSPEHLEWIRPWMTRILAMDRRRDILQILLFVTRPRSTKEVFSPSATVQMFPGKPDVAALLDKEQARDHRVGAIAVSVCGTGAMADDVRAAARARCQRSELDFFEEAFSW